MQNCNTFFNNLNTNLHHICTKCLNGNKSILLNYRFQYKNVLCRELSTSDLKQRLLGLQCSPWGYAPGRKEGDWIQVQAVKCQEDRGSCPSSEDRVLTRAPRESAQHTQVPAVCSGWPGGQRFLIVFDWC